MIKKILIMSVFFILSINVFAFKKAFVDAPARAVWINSNKLKLTLPNNLNVNGVQFYYLKNDLSKKKIQLSVNTAYDKLVELEINQLNQQELLSMITGPISLVTYNKEGDVVDETSVQLAGLLDQRFFYSGNDLGVEYFVGGIISLKLWAPTALDVKINFYKNSNDLLPSFAADMKKDLLGVWQVQTTIALDKYYYQYSVTVYSPNTKSVETFLVTDPYSKSLSQNSNKSQLVNVEALDLKPNNWDFLINHPTPTKVIYETHVRDLTAVDTGINENERGTFIGLSRPTSKARLHLKALADNGLTHIHFLPINDFASVNEDRSTWESLDLNQKVDGASDRPQSVINKIRNVDSYNWGYDPYHYFVPEGSYSKNPDGAERIKELRTMIQSLNQIGLKTIVDVVFNHTYSSGIDSFSVLNKIVPLYYYRVDALGNISNSSCCSDTASENKMMEKLMIDAVVFWAKTYKVDGFRFDLMSFHTRENILKIKEALDKLTLAKDGINGSDIYLYGEGWTFGSLVQKNPGNAFTQLNSYGAGIGFFNDRFRDAIRGGTTDSSEKSDQGFVTGLFTDFNQEIANRNTPIDLYEQQNKLNHLSEVVKIGLAGNLRDYKLKTLQGNTVFAKDYLFRGMPTGYSASTNETVNYVSAHDGTCLWDAISAKAPFYTSGRLPMLATTFEKQRMQQLALGLTLFSQGVAFIEGGSEILRSKSGDVDSYDSGDWFNHLNFDLLDNNWGAGLPPSFKNYNDWSFWSPRLANPLMAPSKKDITTNLKIFKALLKIRQSSSLFLPKNVSEVMDTVSFFEDEVSPKPGLLSMYLKNKKEKLIIIFNVNKTSISLKNNLLGMGWELHPDLDTQIDPVLKDVQIHNEEISIPPRSVVVLVPKEFN